MMGHREGSDQLVSFDPRTPRQAAVLEVFRKNDALFLLGPAGTGKTHLAVFCALNELYPTPPYTPAPGYRKRDKIIITRPAVESGEKLGALPGGIDDKLSPYMRPIYDCVAKMVNNNPTILSNIELSPLAYMRGRTFEDCVAVLDEAQNATHEQILMFLTRLGYGGKLIVTGDMDQTDIKGSGLRDTVDKLYGEPGVGIIRFQEDDIVRHPLVRRFIKLLSKR